MNQFRITQKRDMNQRYLTPKKRGYTCKERGRVTFLLPQIGSQLHATGPLPFSQGKTGQPHAAGPFPLPKEKTESDQLHANLLGCCVRRELEGRRSDWKHSVSRSLDLPPEPAVAMATTHNPSPSRKLNLTSLNASFL